MDEHIRKVYEILLGKKITDDEVEKIIQDNPLFKELNQEKINKIHQVIDCLKAIIKLNVN